LEDSGELIYVVLDGKVSLLFHGKDENKELSCIA